MHRAFILAAAFVLGSHAPAGASELVLEASQGFLVPAEINGTVLTLRVDPAASGFLVLNRDAARRAKVEADTVRTPPDFPGMRFRKAFAKIGSVRLEGLSGRATASISGTDVPVQAVWFDRDAAEDADGIISPHHLPYDSVRFDLAPPAAGETESSLDVEYGSSPGLYHRLKVDGEEVAVQLSVHKPRSLATAAAGAVIGRHHSGAWAGEDERGPVSFGVSRPMRLLALREPVLLDGLSVDRFLVRTQDHRGGFVLPAEAGDPDEILVTASLHNQPPRLTLVLGREQFTGCSSLTYRRGERRLSARCAQVRR